MCTAVGAKRFVEEAAFIAYNINQWKPAVADYIQLLLIAQPDNCMFERISL